MATFIMLTRVSEQALQSPSSFEKLGRDVSERIRSDCPEVEWKQSYAVLGPADYLDIFTAPDMEAAMKVAAVVRSFGHASTEVWGATEWEQFKNIVAPMAAQQPATAMASV
ncbi:MAG TPA: GYD domain-containing protein [Hyphomicrobiaceae bacterium]|jgi:uncharacterized protein with GYD domain